MHSKDNGSFSRLINWQMFLFFFHIFKVQTTLTFRIDKVMRESSFFFFVIFHNSVYLSLIMVSVCHKVSIIYDYYMHIQYVCNSWEDYAIKETCFFFFPSPFSVNTSRLNIYTRTVLHLGDLSNELFSFASIHSHSSNR